MAVGAGAVHQWQTTRIGVLGDFAYIMDTAWRIAQGEVMYRDFVLPHSPLTFHVQATLIKLFGFSYRLTVWYCTVVNVAYVLLTYRLLRVLLPPWSAVGLCLPLMWLAPHCIYPHPFYDPDTCLLILLNLNLLHWVTRGRVSAVTAVMCGMTTVLPALAKQNVGYPYLALVVFGVVWWGWLRRWWVGVEDSSGVDAKDGGEVGVRWFGVGILVGLAVAVLWLGATCGLDNYWFWVFVSASQRLARPTIKETYGDWAPWVTGGLLTLGWWLWKRKPASPASPRSILFGTTLLLGPFVVVTATTVFFDAYFVEFDYPLLWLWVPVMSLTFVGGIWRLLNILHSPCLVSELLPWFGLSLTFFSFLSQGYVRSSYGIWALFVLMIAFALQSLGSSRCRAALCWGMGLALVTAAVPYIQNNVRLRYTDQSGATRQTASTGPLRGLTAFSPQLSNFAELLSFVGEHIPEDEPVVCIPQEDPFYVMTGRRPPLPMVIFDRTANPFPPEQIVQEAERRRVKWVIIKQHLQMGWFLRREIMGIPERFLQRYKVIASLSGYVILYQPALEQPAAEKVGSL